MTQKEAIIKALEELGGKARLADIYPRVIRLVDFKEGSDKQATIRATLQRTTDHFRPTPGKKGWWELVSYQEEIANMKQTISELTVQLAEKNNAIEELKKVKTEVDFVKRLLKETKKMFKHNKERADVVRLVLDKMGCTVAEAELDAWIDGGERPSIAVNGDFVMNKHEHFNEE